MKRLDQFRKQFNPRFLLVRILANALVLFAVAGLTPIRFLDRTLPNLIFLAAMLGVLNAVLRPVLQFLTFSFVFVTYGLVVVLIDAVVLMALARFFPERIEVPSLLWGFIGGAIMGVLSSFLESLLGLTTPIVPESEAELRQRLERRPSGFTNFILASTSTVDEEAEAAATPAKAPVAEPEDAPAPQEVAPAEEEPPLTGEGAAEDLEPEKEGTA